ncbi:hypothetical protein IX315_001806 [Porphyromonas levii]|nr:hypothetical protein [Porphyromonas levii]MBR8732337.1 hypothetical protein [Porphyromonas levii]
MRFALADIFFKISHQVVYATILYLSSIDSSILSKVAIIYLFTKVEGLPEGLIPILRFVITHLRCVNSLKKGWHSNGGVYKRGNWCILHQIILPYGM